MTFHSFFYDQLGIQTFNSSGFNFNHYLTHKVRNDKLLASAMCKMYTDEVEIKARVMNHAVWKLWDRMNENA
jgi:hypothetical protein